MSAQRISDWNNINTLVYKIIPSLPEKKKSKLSGLLFLFWFSVLFSFVVLGCGAPKLDDDFLYDENLTRSSDNFIAEALLDENSLYRIDAINSEISSFETAYRNASNKELVSKMDSLLKEISEIKRSISSPIQTDHAKLDNYEKENLNQAKKIKELENRIKTISENSGVTLSQNSEMKSSFDKAPTKEINTLDDFNANYDYGISLYNKKKYDEAYSVFLNLINSRLKKPDLIDNIFFWMGECCFQTNKFNDAISNFRNVLTQPNANKVEDTLWKLALSYEKINKIEEARESLHRLIDSFPKGRYTERAQSKLKILI
jgi:TolA-binding protein